MVIAFVFNHQVDEGIIHQKGTETQGMIDCNNSRTIVERATDDFLRHLRERNASAHTIKAYTGDLDVFAAYIGSRHLKTIDHIAIRGFLSHLYDKRLSKTFVARALASLRSLYRLLGPEGGGRQNPAKLG